jgi:hypothetical protein
MITRPPACLLERLLIQRGRTRAVCEMSISMISDDIDVDGPIAFPQKHR